MVRKIKNKRTEEDFAFEADEKENHEGRGDFNDFFSIKRFLKQMFLDFLEQIAHQIEESVRAKIQEVFNEVKKIFIVFFLVTMGLAFFLIGIAGVLDEIIGFEGAGFLLMGMVLFFLAWLSVLMSKRQN